MTIAAARHALLVNSSLDDFCAVNVVEIYSVDARADERIVRDLVAMIAKGPKWAYPLDHQTKTLPMEGFHNPLSLRPSLISLCHRSHVFLFQRYSSLLHSCYRYD